MNIDTTTEAICRLLWDSGASEIDPDEARYGVYPDPDGREVAFNYLGEEIRGWPVRKMTGDEEVRLIPAANGNGYHVEAEPWVKDRIGHRFTGREGRRLHALSL